MKNKLRILLGMMLVFVLVFAACGGEEKKEEPKEETKKEDVKEEDKEEVKEEDKKEEEKEEDKKEEIKEEVKDAYDGVEGKITVYVSGPEKMIQKLEEKFEEERGDVIEIYHSGCGPLRQKVWTECEAGQIHADVFWGSNPLIYYMLSEKGELEAYKSPELENLKPEFKLDQNDFSLVSARYEVIAYDKNNVSKEESPKSYKDLLNEEWKNKISYTDLSQSSTAFALSTALWTMNDNSPAFFEGLKANEALIVPKSKTVAEKIQSGELQVGIVPYDAIFRIKKKAKKEGFESNLAASWPSEGAIQLERPIAIIKNNSRPEKNSEIAKEFVDFILSKPAQEMMLKFGFTSVRSDLDQVNGIPAELIPTTIDWKTAQKSEDTIREEFKNIMLGN